jgi:predicted Rossmann fold nucleotide-binding protein DprA/Smf involved in DNA uptake
MNTASVIPQLEKLASTATADIARLLKEVYDMGREDMRRELMALLSPERGGAVALVEEVHVPNIANARTSTKAPPGTVRPAILKMIEQSPGVSTDQILAATGFKENSVRGTLSTLHKEGKIARNAQGYWIKKLEASAEQLAEAS